MMYFLPRTLILTFVVACACLLPAHAEVELQEDGTYVISGQFTFLPDKNMLVPSAKFDCGEFATVLFKPGVNEFPGVREMKKSTATFKVKARAKIGSDGEKILVVEQILEDRDAGAASGDAKQ